MISLQEDEYIRSLQLTKRKAIWVARLSDNSIVYMDDEREDQESHSAWIRLKKYCRSENLYITKLWIKFRSIQHKDILPENAKAYYFCKSVLKAFRTDETHSLYLFGYLDEDNKVRFKKIKVPELIVSEEEVREVPLNSDCLIGQNLD